MTESLAYRDIRRQLLSKNPYFQQDLIEVRRKLGLPEAGFSEAVQKLGEGIPRHPTSLLLGKPNLASLKEKACRLGLPLDDWVAEREAQCAERGMNFEQLIDQVGWGALPIWGFALAEWWIARERKLAGLEPLTFNSQAESQGQSSQLLNTCLPSAQAALSLARRYRLGDDYTPTTASLILGCPPGGGEADIVIEHRRDGAGLRVVLPCVRYDCTLAKWQQIFLDAIQPTLFRHASKLPSEVPFHEAIKEARRRAKPGKPPYTQKTLETHLRMWEFCYQHSFLSKGRGLSKGKGAVAINAFLTSLPDAERQGIEELDLETIRRSVNKLDQHLRPRSTGSGPDF